MTKWTLSDFKTIASIILTLSAAYGAVRGTNTVVSHFDNPIVNTNKNDWVNNCQIKLDAKDKEINQVKDFIKTKNEKSNSLFYGYSSALNKLTDSWVRGGDKNFKEEFVKVEPKAKLQFLSKISERFLDAKDYETREAILKELKWFSPAVVP